MTRRTRSAGDIVATAAVNRADAEAAAILDAGFLSLDYRYCEMDSLDEAELRGRMVRVCREFRPDLVMSYDAWGRYEENPDHLKCAWAMTRRRAGPHDVTLKHEDHAA